MHSHVRIVHLAYSVPATLQGLNLDGVFVLDHIHVHWGGSDERGSEHSLDGIFFPAEVANDYSYYNYLN